MLRLGAGLVAGVVVALALVGAYAVVFHDGRVVPRQVANAIRHHTMAGCARWYVRDADQTDCFEEEALHVVESRGVGPGIDELNAFASRHAVLGDRCHGLMHAVGARYYERHHGERAALPGTAMREAIGNCGTGFVHGVIESTFANYRPGDPLDAMQGLCVRQPAGTRRWECFHALGHVFVRANRGDVVAAQEACTRLGAGAGYCAPAVFHELALSREGAGDARFPLPRLPRSTRPERVCALALTDYRAACWLRMLQDGLARGTVSHRHLLRFDDAIALCPAAHRSDPACVTGAVAQVTLATGNPYTDGSGLQLKLCDSAPDAWYQTCLRGLDARVMAISRIDSCADVAEVRRSRCTTGVTRSLVERFPQYSGRAQAHCVAAGGDSRRCGQAIADARMPRALY